MLIWDFGVYVNATILPVNGIKKPSKKKLSVETTTHFLFLCICPFVTIFFLVPTPTCESFKCWIFVINHKIRRLISFNKWFSRFWIRIRNGKEKVESFTKMQMLWSLVSIMDCAIASIVLERDFFLSFKWRENAISFTPVQ